MTTNGEGTIRISQVTDNPTIAYAAEELKRCLSSMSVQSVDIRLGLIADLSDVKGPSVADSTLDDAIEADIKNGIGYIAGINPRSVLIGGVSLSWRTGLPMVTARRGRRVFPDNTYG